MWKIQPIIRQLILLQLELEMNYDQRYNLHQAAFDFYHNEPLDRTLAGSDERQLTYMAEAIYHKCEIYQIRRSSLSLQDEIVTIVRDEHLPLLAQSVGTPLFDRAQQYLDQLAKDNDIMSAIGPDGYDKLADTVDIFVKHQRDNLDSAK